MGLRKIIQSVESDFKKRMENQNDQDVRLNLDKPEDGQPETETVADTEDTAVEAKTEGEPEFTPKGKVDPTFNCPECIGEGMLFNAVWPSGRICPNCQGTGKLAE